MSAVESLETSLELPLTPIEGAEWKQVAPPALQQKIYGVVKTFLAKGMKVTPYSVREHLEACEQARLKRIAEGRGMGWDVAREQLKSEPVEPLPNLALIQLALSEILK